MDTSRLVKLLNLTQSENDGEALNAVRAANAFLKKHSASWSTVLRAPSPHHKVHFDPFEELVRQKKQQMAERDRRAREQASTNQAILLPIIMKVCIEVFEREKDAGKALLVREFQKFYNKHGYLPEKQRAALDHMWKTVQKDMNK